jgi:hypothetical protein
MPNQSSHLPDPEWVDQELARLYPSVFGKATPRPQRVVRADRNILDLPKSCADFLAGWTPARHNSFGKAVLALCAYLHHHDERYLLSGNGQRLLALDQVLQELKKPVLNDPPQPIAMRALMDLDRTVLATLQQGGVDA